MQTAAVSCPCMHTEANLCTDASQRQQAYDRQPTVAHVVQIFWRRAVKLLQTRHLRAICLRRSFITSEVLFLVQTTPLTAITLQIATPHVLLVSLKMPGGYTNATFTIHCGQNMLCMRTRCTIGESQQEGGFPSLSLAYQGEPNRAERHQRLRDQRVTGLLCVASHIRAPNCREDEAMTESSCWYENEHMDLTFAEDYYRAMHSTNTQESSSRDKPGY